MRQEISEQRVRPAAAAQEGIEITMMTLQERPIGRTYRSEAHRDAALDRLVALLMENGPEMRILPPAADTVSDISLGRLARLRAARAVYFLNSSGEIVRENDGAWTRRPVMA